MKCSKWVFAWLVVLSASVNAKTITCVPKEKDNFEWVKQITIDTASGTVKLRLTVSQDSTSYKYVERETIFKSKGDLLGDPNYVFNLQSSEDGTTANLFRLHFLRNEWILTSATVTISQELMALERTNRVIYVCN